MNKKRTFSQIHFLEDVVRRRCGVRSTWFEKMNNGRFEVLNGDLDIGAMHFVHIYYYGSNTIETMCRRALTTFMRTFIRWGTERFWKRERSESPISSTIHSQGGTQQALSQGQFESNEEFSRYPFTRFCTLQNNDVDPDAPMNVFANLHTSSRSRVDGSDDTKVANM